MNKVTALSGLFCLNDLAMNLKLLMVQAVGDIISSMFLWLCSSLSVFALHPLYLRVQALSDKISEDVKVLRVIDFFMLDETKCHSICRLIYGAE